MTKIATAIIKTKDEFGRDQYLLIQSTKDFGEQTGFWYPPGRHIEDKTSEEILTQVLQEDLNLKIKPVRVIAETPTDIPDQKIEWWECELIEDNFKILKEEINDAEYFTKDQMSVIYLWPSTKKFFEEYIFKSPIK